MKIFLFLILLFEIVKLEAQQIIKSSYLSTSINYHIYDVNPEITQKKIYYFTDGQKVQDYGLLEKLVELTATQKIPAAYYILVSTIDPMTKEDRRNEYFFCNEKYLSFFEQELIPTVEEQINYKFTKKDRGLIGISFGGLNGAYFSANSTLFTNYGLLSPITYPCPTLNQQLIFSKNKDLNVFLSTGKNDAEKYVESLDDLYHSKGFRVLLHQTERGHDFENWKEQLEHCLLFLH